MSKMLTIKEIQQVYNVPDSTTRGWIKKGKLTTNKVNVNQKATIVVSIDHKFKNEYERYKNVVVTNNDNNYVNDDVMITNDDDIQQINEYSTITNDEVKEADIIDDSATPNMVNTYNQTIEQLLQSIKEMAQNQINTEQEAYKRLLEEYHELKTTCSNLQSENKDLVLKTAQLEAENKINNMRIKELEKENLSWWQKKL